MNPAQQFWMQTPLLSTRRRNFLGAPVHLLTMRETLQLAVEAMQLRKPLRHTVVNVAKLVNMQSDPELRTDVGESDVINLDGMGVVWGARLLGLPAPGRVAGCDLMTELFERCGIEGFRPFLLGGEAPVLAEVQRRLRVTFPAIDIAGAADGYFATDEEQALVDSIAASGADCLFVAMPSPRKERFIAKYHAQLNVPFVMGVGGSFDVYAGKVRRAPKIVQAVGMEWLFRVAQEPKRLWRRYYDTNWRFIGLLVHELARSRSAVKAASPF